MASKSTPVSTYMTPHPHSVGHHQSVAMAHELMRKHHVRHLPVLDGGHVVGLVSITDLDLIEGLEDTDPDRITVEEAMSSDPYVVPTTKPLGELAREMTDRKRDSAIVLEGNRVVGVFTSTDALRALSDVLG